MQNDMIFAAADNEQREAESSIAQEDEQPQDPNVVILQNIKNRLEQEQYEFFLQQIGAKDKRTLSMFNCFNLN